METSDRLNDLAERVREHATDLHTEEATKTALIMPFISQALGYDVYNPREVIPEYTADYGTRKGEKVDYAITHNGVVQILIEAKTLGAPLDVAEASQLFRYFSVSHARIGILTDGRRYLFFTDLDKPNVMDKHPFLKLDLLDVDPAAPAAISKLSKQHFNIDAVVSSAEELKYVGDLKRLIASEFANPSEGWVRWLGKQVYHGTFSAKTVEQFTGLVSKASRQFLAESVNDRLERAIIELPEPEPTEAQPAPQNQVQADRLAFWTILKEYASQHHPALPWRNPNREFWQQLSCDRAGAAIQMRVNIDNMNPPKIGVEYFFRDNKPLYDALHKHRAEIEAEFGQPLIWERRDDQKQSFVQITTPGDYRNPAERERLARWMADTAAAFHRIVPKYDKR